MGSSISFIQYMRAHGNTPGPTQRPYLTGTLSGLAAAIPSQLISHYSGASASVALGLDVGLWLIFVLETAVFLLAGMLYAAVFKRAANDCEGGWLFGISYGFLLWMLAPVTLWETITSRPLAVGPAAMGLFGAHVIYGLVLGLLFPRVHTIVQKRLRDVEGPRNEFGQAKNAKPDERKRLKK